MLDQRSDDGVSDLVLFHFFEETEHGALKAQVLQVRTTFLSRLLCVPVMIPRIILLFILFLLLPPLMKILSSPFLLLLKPIATITDGVNVYIAFVPVFCQVICYLFTYYLSSFATDPFPVMTKTFDYFKRRIEERGIEFSIVKQEEYALEYALAY